MSTILEDSYRDTNSPQLSLGTQRTTGRRDVLFPIVVFLYVETDEVRNYISLDACPWVSVFFSLFRVVRTFSVKTSEVFVHVVTYPYYSPLVKPM